MPCNNHNASRSDPLVSWLRASSLLLAAMLTSPAALAVDSGDIFVVSSKGEVHVTMNGAVRNVRAGSVLELPASVRTGRDGGIELKQGMTTVSVGPDTELEFPALEAPGAPIDRIQQPRGNAFYNIGKRDGRKLRVETPYLVGVVKGTQFNVAAQEAGTTISLFEGLLEIRPTDDGAAVDLRAGEIATRRRGDPSINVLKMDAGKATTAPTPQASAVDGHGLDPVGDSGADTPTANNVIPMPGAVSAGLSTASPASVVADVGANAGIAAGPVTVDAGASASVDPGAGVSTDVGASAAVDAGAVSAGLDTNAAVDVGASGAALDLSTTAAVDAGPVAVDVGTNAAVDVGTSGLGAELTTGAGIDAGPITADIGATTGLDVDTHGAVSVNTGVALGVVDAPVDVSTRVDVGADLSSGTVDLGVAVGGVDLGLGLDLGLDGNEPATDTGSSTTPATDTGNTGTVDVGGLLDSLLRRPGRK